MSGRLRQYPYTLSCLQPTLVCFREVLVHSTLLRVPVRSAHSGREELLATLEHLLAFSQRHSPNEDILAFLDVGGARTGDEDFGVEWGFNLKSAPCELSTGSNVVASFFRLRNIWLEKRYQQGGNRQKFGQTFQVSVG